MIESCLVIALVCLIFLGLFQVSQLAAGHEVLHHAAARAARAKTVGFNLWMVEKSALVAGIPNAGQLITPEFDRVDPNLRNALATQRPGPLWDNLLASGAPASAQYALERARIPEFMAAENAPRARFILDYAAWDTLRLPFFAVGDPAATNAVLEVSVGQDYPLWVPMHRLYYATDSVNMNGDASIENHYPLYLEDRYW